MNRPKSIDHYVYIPREGEDVKKIILPDSEYCNGYYRNGNNYYIGYMKQVDSLRNPEPESIEGFCSVLKSIMRKYTTKTTPMSSGSISDKSGTKPPMITPSWKQGSMT